MADLCDQGVIDRAGRFDYREWAETIKFYFEECFYIPESEEAGYEVNWSLVNRRGIYKDSFRSTQCYTDYQLRPNLCVAMAVAPEIFDRKHAKRCLEIVEDVLLSPGAMGIKTLDPSDKNYRGDYVNSDSSHGWNYH